MVTSNLVVGQDIQPAAGSQGQEPLFNEIELPGRVVRVQDPMGEYVVGAFKCFGSVARRG